MILSISKGQSLDKIPELNPIPSKTIINKALTGIGGTTCEIMYPRHSIIIVPNIPVIIGKMERHTTILGVYSATSDKKIKDYFRDTSIKYKKFITTPESFERIVNVGRKLGLNIYNDYFLLFDECDRTIKDVNFREKIIVPLKYLSVFKNYAFISATVLRASNPLLKNLESIYLVPNYSVTKDIDLICTNHPYQALKEQIAKADKKVFIFCASLRVIDRALDYLSEYSRSAIFCSEQRLEDMPNNLAFSDSVISMENLQKFNFLTSRFNAAVDINYDEDCEIIILSDIKYRRHSLVDPRTDVVQIIGRFRNKEIKKSVTVISNCDEDIDVMTIPEFNTMIERTRSIYNYFKVEMETASDKIHKKVFYQHLIVLPFNKYLDENGNENSFLIDNYLFDEIIKSYYQSFEHLESAYINCKLPRSEMPYFSVNRIDKIYSVSSDKMKSKDKLKTYRDKIKYIADILDHIVDHDKKISDVKFDYLLLDKYKYHYPEIFEAFDLLGHDELCNYYSKEEILDAIKKVKRTSVIEDPTFRSIIYSNFHEGDVLEGKVIKDTLERLFTENKITHIHPTIKFLRNYFDIDDKGQKGKKTERNKTFYRLKSMR